MAGAAVRTGHARDTGGESYVPEEAGSIFSTHKPLPGHQGPLGLINCRVWLTGWLPRGLEEAETPQKPAERSAAVSLQCSCCRAVVPSRLRPSEPLGTSSVVGAVRAWASRTPTPHGGLRCGGLGCGLRVVTTQSHTQVPCQVCWRIYLTTSYASLFSEGRNVPTHSSWLDD